MSQGATYTRRDVEQLEIIDCRLKDSEFGYAGKPERFKLCEDRGHVAHVS